MKKLFCLVTALVFVFAFVSCSAGVSIPYRTIQLANRYSEIFSETSGIAAFRETLDYGDYSYSVYYEKVYNGKLLTYNIAETAPDYALYARNGRIFIEKNGKKYALLQISGTYSDFVGKYAEYDHPLDAGSHYQVRSEKTLTLLERLNGFFRICCELESDFASMALLAAIQSKDKSETKKRAGKLLVHPMFKKWKDLHGTALTKNLDLSKIF